MTKEQTSAESSKKYREVHKERIKTQKQEYRKRNKNKIRQQKIQYYKENRTSILAKKRKYYKDNINIFKKRDKDYRIKNVEKIKEKNKKRYTNNQEKLKQYRINSKDRIKSYYINNKSYILQKQKIYERKKRKTNLSFKLLKACRLRIYYFFKANGKTKNVSETKLVGCSANELKHHFQSLYKEGMSDENYGVKGWVVDHIIPCSSFDITDPEQLKKCFHYTNLQPLWWYENLAKSDR